MNALRQLQQTFQDYVLDGAGAIRNEVVSTPKIDADTRLNIYGGGYRARLLEALGNEYPGLRALAGEDDFDALGRAYIDAHPSTFFNLRWFGDRLPRFLRGYPPACPEWGEMAAFEWAMGLAFDAQDSAPLAFETVASAPGEDWPGLTFTAHPSVQRIDLQYSVPAFWKSADTGDVPEAVQRHPALQPWVIWRHDLRTYFRSLNPDEAWALDALIAGQTFSDLCAGLCQWVAEDQVALHAAGFLRNWIAEQMIATMRS